MTRLFDYRLLILLAAIELLVPWGAQGQSCTPVTKAVGGGGSACSGSSVPVTIVNSQADVWYHLKRDGADAAGYSDKRSISGGATHTWNVTQSGTYTVVARFDECSPTTWYNMSGSAAVTINAASTISISTTATSVCAGTTVTLTATGGSGYTWFADVNMDFPINGPSIQPEQTGTYYVTGTATCGGAQTSNSITVTIKPVPYASVSLATQQFCNGQSMTIVNNSSTVSGTTYSWTASSNSNIDGEAGGTGSSISQALSLAAGTVTSQSVTYTVTPTADLCPGSPVTATVTLNPVPAGSVSLATQAICNGASMTTVTSSSTVSGTTYAWTVPANSNINGEVGGTGASISQALSLVAGVVTSQSVTYSVTPTASGCPGTAVPATVTVNPVPTGSVSLVTQAICNGASMTTVTSSSTVSGTTYAWTVPANSNINGEVGGTGASISQALSLVAGVVTSQSVTYSVTPTASGCPGTAVPATVTVNPVPTGSVSLATQTICNGASMTTVTSSSTVSGTTYAWTVPANSNINGEVGGTGASISQALSLVAGVVTSQSVTYSVTPTASGCPGTPVTATVTLNPVPTLAVSLATQNACPGVQMLAVNLTNPNNVAGTTYSWTVSAASISGATAGSPGSTGPINQTLTQTTTSNKVATYTITPTAGACSGTPATSSVTVYAPITPGAIGVAPAICTGSDPAVMTSAASPTGGSGTYSYQWQQSSDNTNWSAASGTNTLATYDPPVLTATRYYRRGVSCSTTIVYTPSTQILVNPVSVGGGVAPGSESYGISSGTISLSGHIGTVLRWQKKVGTGAWTDIANTTTSQLYSNITTTTQYQAEVKSGVCPALFSNPATIAVFAMPSVTITGNTALPPGGSTLLTATGGMFQYRWDKDNVEIPGEITSNYVVTHPGSYKVRVKGSPTAIEYSTGSAVITYAFEDPLQDVNYVQTISFFKQAVTSATNIYDLAAKDFSISTSYIDGLGRPIQTVVLGAGGDGSDLIQVSIYDEFGREAKKYLPYAGASRDGRYQPAALDQLANFYNTAADVPHDTVPFSKTVFEASPLNRPSIDFGPGQNWSASEANKSMKYTYLVNVHGTTAGKEKVACWEINGSGNPVKRTSLNGGFYPTGSLGIKSTKDEQGNEVREYTDKSGRVVLKKVYAAGTVTDLVTPGNWAETYYIFDQLNQLRFVFQPELSRVLAVSGLDPNSTELANFAFQYMYDERLRMIFKQVPGAEPVFMVYDERDRLVLTQDGNLRTQNKWTFTKYDTLNRPVITGIYSHGSLADEAGMDTLISHSKFCEVANGAVPHGYSNNVFPSSNLEVLTVTYYDSYSYIQSNWGTGFNYINASLSQDGYSTPGTSWPQVLGQVTGTKVKVLSSVSTHLRAIDYYDDRQRLVQTIADNYKGGKDRISTLYDFSGKVLKAASILTVGPVTHTIITRKLFDDAGRPIYSYHKTNTATEVLLSKNEYNSLGQLKAKKLHEVSSNIYLQQLDYRYNIRGWLTSINQARVHSVFDGNSSFDLFGMELGYQNQLSGLTATTVYNGNISSVQWAVAGNAKQAYTFNYDPMNRVLHATHFDKDSLNAWAKHNGQYSERGLTYDLNGNIKTLKRLGWYGIGLDNLAYGYTGNQLGYVSDSYSATLGFANANTGTDDYNYDDNGNMSQDKNKGIGVGNIRYNFLNLPRSVKKSGADSLVYTYDATGRKLSQRLYGAIPKTTDYLNEFIYENDTLKFFNHEEGRVVMTGTPEYQYHLKDHLGNVRVTFTAKPQVAESYTTNFEAASNSNFNNYTTHNFDLVDHTDAAGTTYTKTQLLTGVGNYRVGLARSFSVMPGDVVTAQAYVKYMNLSATPNTNVFINSLAAAFGVTSGSTGEAGKLFSGLNQFAGTVAAGDHPNDSEVAPKAFVTILFFDKDYNFVDAAWKQVTTVAAQTSPSVKQPPHDFVQVIDTARSGGHAYIFLSNENPTLVDVYFDDATFGVMPSPVVTVNDYYPFGLTFNSSNRENSLRNWFQFNNKEWQDELGIGWLDYGWRMYIPEIGRWNGIDLLADTYFPLSPYNYVASNPIRYIDPNGTWIKGKDGNAVSWEINEDGSLKWSENARKNTIKNGNRLWNSSSGKNTLYKMAQSQSEVRLKISDRATSTKIVSKGSFEGEDGQTYAKSINVTIGLGDKDWTNKDELLRVSLDIASSHLQDEKVNLSLGGQELEQEFGNVESPDRFFDPFAPYPTPSDPHSREQIKDDISLRALTPLAEIGKSTRQMQMKAHIVQRNQQLQMRRYRKPSVD